MHRLLATLSLLLLACGDDVCRHLDPDVRVFWTPEERDACPAAPRLPASATPPPDLGAAPDLATTPSPACVRAGCDE